MEPPSPESVILTSLGRLTMNVMLLWLTDDKVPTRSPNRIRARMRPHGRTDRGPLLASLAKFVAAGDKSISCWVSDLHERTLKPAENAVKQLERNVRFVGLYRNGFLSLIAFTGFFFGDFSTPCAQIDPDGYSFRLRVAAIKGKSELWGRRATRTRVHCRRRCRFSLGQVLLRNVDFPVWPPRQASRTVGATALVLQNFLFGDRDRYSRMYSRDNNSLPTSITRLVFALKGSCNSHGRATLCYSSANVRAVQPSLSICW